MLAIHDPAAPLCDGLRPRMAAHRRPGHAVAPALLAAARAAAARLAGAARRSRASCSSSWAARRSTRPGTPSPTRPPRSAATCKPIASAVPGIHGRRADAAHRPADRQDLRPARRRDQRQRPLVQRLLHDDRLSAPADQRRERQARRAQRLAQPRRRWSSACCRGTGGLPAADHAARAIGQRRQPDLARPGRRLPRPRRRPLAAHCDPSARRLPDRRPEPARRGARRCASTTAGRCSQQVNQPPRRPGPAPATWRHFDAQQPAGVRPARRRRRPAARSTSTRSRPRCAIATAAPRFGQSVLLARRLVEAGVSLVRVNWTRVPAPSTTATGTRTASNTDGLQAARCRSWTRPTRRCSKTWTQRGLLDETLVVWMGEFGRTPKHQRRRRPRPLGPRLLGGPGRRRRPRRRRPRRLRQHRRLSQGRPGAAAGPDRDDLPLPGHHAAHRDPRQPRAGPLPSAAAKSIKQIL